MADSTKKKRRRAISKLSHFNQGGWGSKAIATVPLWGWVCVLCRSHACSCSVCLHMCKPVSRIAYKGRLCDVCVWERLDPEVPTKGPTDPWKSWRHARLCKTATSVAAVVGMGATPQRVSQTGLEWENITLDSPSHDFTRVLLNPAKRRMSEKTIQDRSLLKKKKLKEILPLTKSLLLNFNEKNIEAARDSY